MVADESSIPTKICTKCRQRFPGTPEFFTRHRTRGLHSHCKQCYRAWYAEHREELRVKRARYTAEHRELVREQKARSAQKHRDKILARQRLHARAYRARHPEQAGAWQKANRTRSAANSRAWRERHPGASAAVALRYRERDPERVRSIHQKYRKAHPEKIRLKNERRRTIQRGLPAAFSPAHWQQAKAYWHYACAICGNQEGFFWTLVADHWIPLASPGCPGTVITNMVPLCHGIGACNTSKHATDPVAWLQKKLGKSQSHKKLKEIEAFFAFMLTTYGTQEPEG